MGGMNDWDEVAKGLYAAYHANGHFKQCFARLRAKFEPLEGEMRAIAETSTLPDGDSVNISTQLWAEDWTRGK